MFIAKHCTLKLILLSVKLTHQAFQNEVNLLTCRLLASKLMQQYKKQLILQPNILYRLKSESFALWIWLECFSKECTKKPPCFCTEFRLFCVWFWNRSKNKLLFCSLTLTIQRQIQIQERISTKPASAYLTIVWLQYTKQNSNGMKPHIWNAMRQRFLIFSSYMLNCILTTPGILAPLVPSATSGLRTPDVVKMVDLGWIHFGFLLLLF